MTVERRRNPPHAALGLAELGLLLRRIFVQSVRRIGDDRMETIVLLLPQPVEAIRVAQRRLSKTERLAACGPLADDDVNLEVQTSFVQMGSQHGACCRSKSGNDIGPCRDRRGAMLARTTNRV